MKKTHRNYCEMQYYLLFIRWVIIQLKKMHVLILESWLVNKPLFSDFLFYLQKQGGIVQALTARSKWSGYSADYQGQNRLVFSLTDPKSCFASNSAIRISIDPKGQSNFSWDFYINGSFVDKAFTIIDRNSKIIAQVCLT